MSNTSMTQHTALVLTKFRKMILFLQKKSILTSNIQNINIYWVILESQSSLPSQRECCVNTIALDKSSSNFRRLQCLNQSKIGQSQTLPPLPSYCCYRRPPTTASPAAPLIQKETQDQKRFFFLTINFKPIVGTA